MSDCDKNKTKKKPKDPPKVAPKPSKDVIKNVLEGKHSDETDFQIKSSKTDKKLKSEISQNKNLDKDLNIKNTKKEDVKNKEKDKNQSKTKSPKADNKHKDSHSPKKKKTPPPIPPPDYLLRGCYENTMSTETLYPADENIPKQPEKCFSSLPKSPQMSVIFLYRCKKEIDEKSKSLSNKDDKKPKLKKKISFERVCSFFKKK